MTSFINGLAARERLPWPRAVRALLADSGCVIERGTTVPTGVRREVELTRAQLDGDNGPFKVGEHGPRSDKFPTLGCLRLAAGRPLPAYSAESRRVSLRATPVAEWYEGRTVLLRCVLCHGLVVASGQSAGRRGMWVILVPETPMHHRPQGMRTTTHLRPPPPPVQLNRPNRGLRWTSYTEHSTCTWSCFGLKSCKPQSSSGRVIECTCQVCPAREPPTKQQL